MLYQDIINMYGRLRIDNEQQQLQPHINLVDVYIGYYHESYSGFLPKNAIFAPASHSPENFKNLAKEMGILLQKFYNNNKLKEITEEAELDDLIRSYIYPVAFKFKNHDILEVDDDDQQNDQTIDQRKDPILIIDRLDHKEIELDRAELENIEKEL